MRVSDIMAVRNRAGRVISVMPRETVGVAATRLVEKNIGALAVCEELTKIRGLISERDILKGLTNYGPSVMTEPIEKLMEPVVVYCSPEDDILHVVMVMREEGVRHLPILDWTESIIGIVSIRDLLDCLPLEPGSH